MENQKNKTIKMDVAKGNKKETENPKKYTYDELNTICGQLVQQNKGLVRQLQQLDQAVMLKRIEFLLKIVELSDKIKDADFINSCIEEIKEAMTEPEVEAKDKEEK